RHEGGAHHPEPPHLRPRGVSRRGEGQEEEKGGEQSHEPRRMVTERAAQARGRTRTSSPSCRPSSAKVARGRRMSRMRPGRKATPRTALFRPPSVRTRTWTPPPSKRAPCRPPSSARRS